MKKIKKVGAVRPPAAEFLDDRLRIEWSPGEAAEYNYFRLRFMCPCAACVDELTGVRVLQKESVSPDVKPLRGDFVGNYALRIYWSDNHNTGIYTFASLRSNHPALIK